MEDKLEKGRDVKRAKEGTSSVAGDRLEDEHIYVRLVS